MLVPCSSRARAYATLMLIPSVFMARRAKCSDRDYDVLVHTVLMLVFIHARVHAVIMPCS